jgi:hypothetical protein
MDLSDQAKVKITLPGEAGYKGAWDASRSIEPSQDQVRDAAINGADIDELNEALDRLNSKETRDATTLEALARIKTRIEELIQRSAH